jgi:hypothetical protein
MAVWCEPHDKSTTCLLAGNPRTEIGTGESCDALLPNADVFGRNVLSEDKDDVVLASYGRVIYPCGNQCEYQVAF